MKYIPTIGIETHVQLKTKTKLFSAVDNDARGAAPNTLISHIDFGLPGALPVLNQKAVELAAVAAFALNSSPQAFSKFDRKHYFYPDLPKGYQITQYTDPIIKAGYVEINVGGKAKKVSINRVQLEEDAGKNTHPSGADYSLVDLNRAGTPLLEIVSEPDMASAAQAKAYVRELYLLMKYSQVSDCDLYLGHMRFDVNVSVSADPSKPGTRTETKNLNSFRSVEAAVEYEIKRQVEELTKGNKIIQETRGWDDAKQKTTSQRGKEEAHDYRYMPEPDIPPLELTPDYIKKVQKTLPQLPPVIRQKLAKLNIESAVIEDILDRPAVCGHTLQALQTGSPEDARRIAFWLLQIEPAAEREPDFEEPKFEIKKLIDLSARVSSGELNSTAARTVFNEVIATNEDPQAIIQRLNLAQISDESEVEKIVEQVINVNPKVVEDIKKGQSRAIGFLIGQVMVASKGQANPGVARQILKQKLGI